MTDPAPRRRVARPVPVRHDRANEAAAERVRLGGQASAQVSQAHARGALQLAASLSLPPREPGYFERRLNADPSHGRSHAAGMRGVLQAKLLIGAIDDPLESEADRVADAVVSPSADPVRSTTGAAPASPSQGACAACRDSIGPDAEDAVVRRIYRRAEGGTQPTAAPDDLTARLGPGVPLAPVIRDYFEPRFGADFSAVRVHSGSAADAAARSVDAAAFTLGRDVVFRDGHYAPEGQAGRRLLAHELTHVVQQRASFERVQRDAACPPRATGETARSRTTGGILTDDVVFTPSTRRVDVGDFAVDSPTVPTGVTDSPAWQQAMSFIAGDPSVTVGVEGLTDCAGSDSENLALRQQRARAIIAAMPPAARAKVLFGTAFGTRTFPYSNGTAEGRARNRGARIAFVSAPPRGQNACDMLTRAHNLDEYLFLVRCLETRLGLTAARDAPTALSVLRQIYYGSASWSHSRTSVWNSVIPDRPWTPGNDPTAALHPQLMTALGNSQVVEGTDIGHVFTGIDAMLHPQLVVLNFGRIGFQTALANEEWATWAGDVGSAAAEWTWSAYMGTPNVASQQPVFFQRFASDSDLAGDLDSFAFRAGAGGAASPPAQLMRTVSLTGPLSNMLLQYFRITGSALGAARGDSVRNFVEAYGGAISGHTLTNRPVLVANLRPSVDEFARMFALRQLLSSGPNPPPGAPPFAPLLAGAVDAMTNLFVDWLAARV